MRLPQALRPRRGLQLRLAAGTLGLVGVLLIGVGIFQYLAFRSFLLQQLSESLHRQAHYAIAGRGRPADAASNPSALARDASSPDVRAGIIGDQGKLLALGPAGPAQLVWIPPRAADLQRVSAKDPAPDYWLLDSPAGMVIAVAVPLGPRGSTESVVLEGSLRPTDALLWGDVLIYAAGSAIAVILGAVMSLLLTGRALQRLHRVSLAAAAVGAGDLDRRAGITGADEVASLGAVFDEMVGRLQLEMGRQQASETAMRRFLADASHELRTPIALIRGNLDIIRRGATQDPGDLALSLEDMRRAAIRMSRLVDGLLALARIEQGDRLKLTEVSVRTALNEAARAGRQLAKGREIRVDVQPRLLVSADPEALNRVLMNLLDNAFKYTPEATPIQLVGRAAGPAWVEIEVIDRGPGISEEDQDRIFDRFYRAPAQAAAAAGSGLGLAISAALVERQGGSLTVKSAAGEGCSFVVTLAAPQPASADPTRMARARV